MNAQGIDVYVPGTPPRTGFWTVTGEPPPPRPGQTDTIHAADGKFYGIPWTVINEKEIRDLPRLGKALTDHFNARYQGGAASRDETISCASLTCRGQD